MLHLPPDFESWNELRSVLAAGVPRPSLVFAFVRLWRDLYYSAQATGRVGFISGNSVKLWVADLESAAPSPALPGTLSLRRTKGEGRGEGPDDGTLLLETSGLLVAVDDGYHCPRFARLHPELNPAHVSAAAKGKAVSAYRRNVDRAAAAALQTALLLDRKKFTLPDGTAADSGLCTRAMNLIVAFDGALGRTQPRQESDADYPEGLVQAALALLAAHDEEHLLAMAEAVMLLVTHGGHPALPGTTEQLLPRFDELRRLPELAGQLAAVLDSRRRSKLR